MSKLHLVPISILLFVVAVAAGACGGTSGTASTSNTYSSKAAFCGYNTQLVKAGSNVTSAADFLTALKANSAAIVALAKNIPNDNIRPDAQAIADAYSSAITSNSASALGGPSLDKAALSVDTYCGVQTNGTPLPADFAAGKGTAFCADLAALNTGLTSAANSADAIAFLKANQAKLDDLAAHIPSAVKTDAESLVSAARAAVASNDASQIEGLLTSAAAKSPNLYCGSNQ